jgi:hypothetical protein
MALARMDKLVKKLMSNPEKVLMLPVVYEKYNYLLSMNINAEIYKFSFTEKNFSKCAHLLTFFQSLEQIK